MRDVLIARTTRRENALLVTDKVMTERFSNFKKAGDLTLPFTYKIDVSMQGPDATTSLTWTTNFQQVYFNEQLDASAFKVS